MSKNRYTRKEYFTIVVALIPVVSMFYLNWIVGLAWLMIAFVLFADSESK